jgi:hypothetical protein
MCRRWGLCRGLWARFIGHKNRSTYFTFAQGAIWTGLLLPLDFEQGRNRSSTVATDRWRRQWPGGRGTRLRRENGENSKGISMASLPWTEKGGEMAGGGIHGGQLGPQGAAVLRRWAGDGERLRRRNASTWTPGQPRLGPVDGGDGESGGDRLGADTGGGARCSWPATVLRGEEGGARGRLEAALLYWRVACRACHRSQGVPAPDSGGAVFGADCAWAQMGSAGGLGSGLVRA